jgi:hypothetical protein
MWRVVGYCMHKGIKGCIETIRLDLLRVSCQLLQLSASKVKDLGHFQNIKRLQTLIVQPFEPCGGGFMAVGRPT